MSKTLDEVTQEAVELTPRERLKLARILIELSEQNPEPVAEVEGAWDKEIEKRLDELRSGKVKGIPLDEVKRKIEKRFRS